MIIDFFINLIYSIVDFIIGDEPVEVSQTAVNNVVTGIENIGKINMVFPFTEFLWLIGVMIAFEFAYLSYKGVMWIIRRLPTQS